MENIIVGRKQAPSAKLWCQSSAVMELKLAMDGFADVLSPKRATQSTRSVSIIVR